MNFDVFREKYKNLIYAPLDIEVPYVDVKKLIQWGIDHKEEVIYDPYVSSIKRYKPDLEIFSKEQWLTRNDDRFWQSYYVRSNSEWLAGFDKEFPQLYKFLKSLPMVALGSVGFIVQNAERSDVDTSPIHTDEGEGLGMRLTIGEDVSGLYFHKFKKGITKKEASGRYQQLAENYVYNRLHDYGHYKIVDRNFVINTDVIESERIYAVPPKQHAQLYLLTNDVAPHAVELKKCPRVTFAIFGKSNYHERFYWQDLDHILERSKEKYNKNFIYL